MIANLAKNIKSYRSRESMKDTTSERIRKRVEDEATDAFPGSLHTHRHMHTYTYAHPVKLK